jgi:hypothetical protein
MEETSECCANCNATLKAPDPWIGGVLAVTREIKKMETIHPFSLSMGTMLKEASYFLSGFHSDKECQNENSPLTLHMRILCNFFILP